MRGHLKSKTLKYLSFFMAFALFVLFVSTYQGLKSQVVERFEGRRFVMPSQVYARPLELFPRLSISRSLLVEDLKRLSYKKSSSLDKEGTYKKGPFGLDVHLRAFDFWDGPREAMLVRLHFDASFKTLLSITDATGEEKDLIRLDPLFIGGIYPKLIEDRHLVPLDRVPSLLIEGLLAVEDRGFREHYGVSPSAILRAFLANIKAGSIVQGGSTLTQQLVKNLFLTKKQTLSRKALEAAMALIVELSYSKEEILETYINQVYFGQNGNRGFHGFSLASQRFFGASLEQLEVSQIALLVGMLKGPNYYDPRRSPKRALARRDQVLGIFYARGLLAKESYQKALSRPLLVKPKARLSLATYPDYVDLVKRQLATFYSKSDLEQEGLRIFTHLEPRLQEAANDSPRTSNCRPRNSISTEENTSSIKGVRTGYVKGISQRRARTMDRMVCGGLELRVMPIHS